MHDQPSGAGKERAITTLEDDDHFQASVLRGLMLIYPEPVTLAELICEKTIGSTDFAECDRVERAVRDLTAAGLLYRRDDDLVMPTRSAVRFYVLFEL